MALSSIEQRMQSFSDAFILADSPYKRGVAVI